MTEMETMIENLRQSRVRIGELIRTYGVMSTQVGEEYDFYSDYHKDIFGVRPRFATKEEFVQFFTGET